MSRSFGACACPSPCARAFACITARAFACSVLALSLAACGGGKANKPSPGPAAEIGSARITWRILSSTGDPQSCTEIGVDSAVVSLGGKSVTVQCGMEQVAVFENLIAERYPVIVQLMKLRTSVFKELGGNVFVEGGKQAMLELVFRNDPVTHAGAINFSWTVNSEPASTGCAAVGGSTVQIQDSGDSVDHFNREVDCALGAIKLEDLRPGTYGAILVLKDDQGARISANGIDRIQVVDGQTTSAPVVSLAGRPLAHAHMLARWTVSGTVAARGCAQAGADAVVLTTTPIDTAVAILTASVACSRGELFIEEVQAAPHPYRVAFELYRDFFTPPPHFPARLAIDIVSDVYFVRGRTSTVSIDLMP